MDRIIIDTKNLSGGKHFLSYIKFLLWRRSRADVQFVDGLFNNGRQIFTRICLFVVGGCKNSLVSNSSKGFLWCVRATIEVDRMECVICPSIQLPPLIDLNRPPKTFDELWKYLLCICSLLSIFYAGDLDL
jgi:hypothetical protein